MKFSSTIIFGFVLGFLALGPQGEVLAQGVPPVINIPVPKNPYTKIVCGDTKANIPGCVSDSATYLSIKDNLFPAFSVFQVGFIGIIAVVILTIAGFFLITSLGDPADKKKALGMLYNVMIGLFIALTAYIIVQLVLGLNFQNVTWVPPAWAQGTNSMIPPVPTGANIPNIPAGNVNQNLGFFVEGGLNIMFYVAGPIVVLVFIILGIRLVMAEGKDDEYKKAMKGIGYAALGLSFMGLAYAAVRILISIRF